MIQFPPGSGPSGFSSNQHVKLAHDWQALLGQKIAEQIDLKGDEYREILDERCVLVTGAGGWIGSRLARRLTESTIRKLILLDSSESALYETDQALGDTGPLQRKPVLANICDGDALGDVFERDRPDIIFHAAALKHVPLMESHPFEVVSTNTLGTARLSEAAQRFGCEQIVMISTDKAVGPASLMGATKRMAELIMLGMDSGALRTRVIRLGNVLGSSGSVVPLFFRQIACGQPLTVSHLEARRFFISTEGAVEEILDSLSPRCPDGLLVAVPGDPIRIVDLANFLISEYGLVDPESAKRLSIVFTGLRPGDKLEESLISGSEKYTGEVRGLRRKVITLIPPRAELQNGIDALASAVQRRNLDDLLQATLRLVPEYRPGSLILQQVQAACGAEMA